MNPKTTIMIVTLHIVAKFSVSSSFQPTSGLSIEGMMLPGWKLVDLPDTHAGFSEARSRI
jgi:hypothetical protein